MSEENECCMSEADDALLKQLAAAHQTPWDKKGDFGTFRAAFLQVTEDTFASMSHDCRACLLQAVQAYCQNVVGNAYEVSIKDLAKATKRAFLRFAIPTDPAGFEQYRVAVLYVMPSMGMRIETRMRARASG